MAKLFFSYSHEDEELRNELETHLALLKRQGVISSWHDRRITAGSDFDQTISSELESSQIILLLVSAHFLASDYCYEKEMTRALEKHEDGSAVVIPVILHPCDWHSAPFGNLRATPTDGKPVSMYANQHEAFAIVAKDVREAAKLVPPPESSPKGEQYRVGSLTSIPQGDRSSNLRIKRKFDDHERDEFLEDSYEYMARYFEGSLQELSARNSHITTRFQQLSETSFASFIYDSGERVAQCSVYYGESSFGSPGIAYSQSGDVQRNSFNESLSVVDDGYTLQLKPLGMQIFGDRREEALSQQGAAEYYWSLFIRPLQE
ncbi:MAG: toll/interleukin-1 receptor domain-containing protein [Proteobacteria bacterium]|nr:toll/interleukin-1 receptor domain-containing protein [Pseudomonadota bacterium]MBU4258549.1 toll/interleukin-1 receptor domain-containing protein [Pseudomonadota bacterium]MBU4289041.1 toll/interleukin-1 receptor domain-containing protein [Pseudomonadota bacterium]MBU4415337.1 toll/interleukin-1 receptor domain-containing protein [Pseudomonadota bacterium]MCG2757258.1 toll/interleukin-1 receptor domain-containing protein [Desulfobacteraceae bacterium]